VTRTILLTAFALTAFAFNSILCRLALRGEEADAVGFTAARLVSGAVTLVVISYFFGKNNSSVRSGSWASALFLFAYMICFSLAYLGLSAGTGALILFGSVQLTMIAVSIGSGERPRPLEWIGLAVALAGLVYLVLPGLAAPPLISSLLMASAGAAWGLYTLKGKGAGDPLANTTGNFLRSVPMVGIAAVIAFPNLHVSSRGALLAVLSGSLTSGIGYTVWYAALKHHTATRAAVLQLSVPVLTAAIGIVFMAEIASPQLAIAAAMILGGIAVTIAGKRR
jgi:drug/metabolite transporter (DMT)-like permease